MLTNKKKCYFCRTKIERKDYDIIDKFKVTFQSIWIDRSIHKTKALVIDRIKSGIITKKKKRRSSVLIQNYSKTILCNDKPLPD